MRKYIYILIAWLLFASLGAYIAYERGKLEAYGAFQSGECWLSKANNDVNCTIYIE